MKLAAIFLLIGIAIWIVVMLAGPALYLAMVALVILLVSLGNDFLHELDVGMLAKSMKAPEGGPGDIPQNRRAMWEIVDEENDPG